MARLRRESRTPTEIWPGFVDALSTLLLVTIFMLSVFVLAQFFLGQLLQGQDERLLALQRELRATESDLDDERLRLDDLRRSLAQLNTDLGIARSERDEAEAVLGETLDERDDLDLRLSRAVADADRLQQALAAAARDADAAALDRRAIERALIDAEERVEADRATIEAQLADLVALRQEVEALGTLRDRLEGAIAEQAALLAALEAETADQAQTLADTDEALSLSEEARAVLRRELGQVRDRTLVLEAELGDAQDQTLAAQRALVDAGAAVEAGRAAAEELSEELRATREQLARIEAVLVEREATIEAQEGRIQDLDVRLATALAREVDELQRFRSDFFGRLSEVLGERADIRVVGDRFVFQSEVLFGRAEATLGAAAQAQLRELAVTLEAVTADLPQDLPWILLINGHTDRRPISTARFPSNWELSTARAISVARFLIGQGLPADRVAAAGFAEHQPLDPADTEAAYQRNRRIEIKLTTR